MCANGHYARTAYAPSGALARGMFALLLDELGDHARPAGLVARADARAGVAVKVFVERHIVAPVRIALEIILRMPNTARCPAASRADARNGSNASQRTR